jgi:hypothetical protein
LVALWEGPCYISGYAFKWGPNIVLRHFALIPGPGAATGCTGVALLAPCLSIVSCLDLIQDLVDTQSDLMVHHAVWSVHCLLCPKGELIWAILDRTPAGS